MNNTGTGAATMRVEGPDASSQCWFNEKTTEAGRDALSYYHERHDENRNVGLRQEHSWAPHAADAFGCLDRDTHLRAAEWTRRRLQHYHRHASITNTVCYTAMSPEPV